MLTLKQIIDMSGLIVKFHAMKKCVQKNFATFCKVGNCIFYNKKIVFHAKPIK